MFDIDHVFKNIMICCLILLTCGFAMGFGIARFLTYKQLFTGGEIVIYDRKFTVIVEESSNAVRNKFQRADLRK